MGKSAFIFPGQGAQYVGMGKELYKSFPVAKETFDCAGNVLGFDIARLCFDGPEDILTSTQNSQPAILATSIAALRVFRVSSGTSVTAEACAGLSLGEYSALVAADVLSFEDALRLVRQRGEFMEDASRRNPGTMAAIMGLDVRVVEAIAKEGGSEVANLNCPGQVIISGSTDGVGKTVALAKEKGALKCIPLNVSGPFHSSLMDTASERLANALQSVPFREPKIPFISNVTASRTDDVELIKKNLALQVNHRTLWESSIRRMMQDGIVEFYEIGPGKVLKGLLRKIDRGLEVRNIENPSDVGIRT